MSLPCTGLRASLLITLFDVLCSHSITSSLFSLVHVQVVIGSKTRLRNVESMIERLSREFACRIQPDP